jgi:hypothetical protein
VRRRHDVVVEREAARGFGSRLRQVSHGVGFAGLAPVSVVSVVSDQPSVKRYPGAVSGQLVKDAAR